MKKLFNKMINFSKPNWVTFKKTEDPKVKAEPLSQLAYMPAWWKALKKNINSNASKGTGYLLLVFLMNILLIPAAIAVWMICQLLFTHQHNQKLKKEGEHVFGRVLIPTMCVGLGALLLLGLNGYKNENNPESIENKFNASHGIGENDPNSMSIVLPAPNIDATDVVGAVVGPQMPQNEPSKNIVITQNTTVQYDNLVVTDDTTTTTLITDGNTSVRQIVVE